MGSSNTQSAEIGIVPTNWQIMPLEDFTERVTYGFTNPMPDAEEGPFKITAKDINHGRVLYETARRTTPSAYRDELTDKSRPKVDDLLVTKDGTLGRVAVCDRENVCINQSVAVIRPNEQIDSQFFKYLLLAPHYQQRMIGDSDGTTIKHIYITRLARMEIVVPPLPEQHGIAHILGTLDDKIELNRRMNETLEAIAQELFKSWFVDFDPVIDKALAAGNPIPESLHKRAEARRALGDQRIPLPGEIEDQFPSRFVFSDEMGWAPEGWPTMPLDHIADYQNGLALQKFRPEDEDDYLPVVKIAQLKKGYADGEEKASPNIKPSCIIDDGDVVFSWSGSLMVDIWCGGRAALNQHLFKVTSEVFPKWLYYQCTLHHLHEFQRIAADKAVTMGHIKREHLKQALCAVPTTTLIDKCSRMIDEWQRRAIECRVENKQLAKLRDILLPKLLSGELRIPDAEKRMEKAL